MKTGGFEIGHNTEVTQERKPLAKRLASWSRPLTASMAPLVSRVFRKATTPLQCC